MSEFTRILKATGKVKIIARSADGLHIWKPEQRTYMKLHCCL